MKTILFVSYGGGHVKALMPIYKALINRYKLIYLGLTTASTQLMENGITSLGFKDFKEILSTEVLNWGQELSDNLEPRSDVSKEESIAYLGRSFSDLVDECGDVEIAKKLYLEKGRAAFLPTLTLEHIVKSIEPDLIISTNSPRAERAALIVARKLLVPSICVTDNLWITGGAREIAAHNLADYICVMSEGVKSLLLEETRYSAERVLTTGSPAFDYLKNGICLKNRTCNTVILLADSHLPERHPIYSDIESAAHLDLEIRAELDRLAKLRGWTVIFRPHPNQKINYEGYRNIEISNPKEPLLKVLPEVDVVVTAISTVGLEAKALGVGLVSIEDTVYRIAGSYSRLGLSTGVTKAEELEFAIDSELSKKEEKIELYEGFAVANICGLIDRVLS